MKTVKTAKAAMATFTNLFLLVSSFALASPIGHAEPIPESASFSALDRDDWLTRMRAAGLRGDRTQILFMVKAFQNPPGMDKQDVAYLIRMSLLRPLAEISATEALPTIDEVIQSDPAKPLPGQPYADLDENQKVITLAKVVKARILAQSATQGQTNLKVRSEAQVKNFFQELGETPEGLNTAVAAFHTQERQHAMATRTASEGRSLSPPVELYAMRELADMAYNSEYRGFASLPTVSRVNFGQDKGAALKVRLAPLSRIQRIQTLSNEVGQEVYEDEQARQRSQLLADEGETARPVIAAKQQDIKANKDQYKRGFNLIPGLTTLARVQKEIAVLGVTGTLKPNGVALAPKSAFLPKQFQFVPGY